MASNRVAPSAYAPSRCAAGTDLSTSRATEDVNGITITARISPAASMPTPSGGPLKIGRARSACGIADSSARTTGTRTKMPQRP